MSAREVTLRLHKWIKFQAESARSLPKSHRSKRKIAAMNELAVYTDPPHFRTFPDAMVPVADNVLLQIRARAKCLLRPAQVQNACEIHSVMLGTEYFIRDHKTLSCGCDG